jgi:hypothetical protein
LYVWRKWQLQVDGCKTEEEICSKIPSSPALPLELLCDDLPKLKQQQQQQRVMTMKLKK